MSPLRRVATGLAVALIAALAPGAAQAAPPASCPNPGPATAGVTSTQVFTGSFSRALAGSYVMVPFDVPAGTTQVRVRYCWDKPENNTAVSHTLDLGIYEPRKAGDTVWGVPEFRGWGGSSHPDVALSDQGFSTQAQYLPRPRGTSPAARRAASTRARSRPGRWAAELGVGAVLPPPDDATGEVGWRVEVELSNAAAYADPATAYAKTPYDSTPAKTGAGWYAGDFHVHGEHSALGNAPISQILDYAFGPRGPGLHRALGLRDRQRMGRDRPLPAPASGQAHHPVLARSSPTTGTSATRPPAASSTTAPGRSRSTPAARPPTR